MNLRLPLILHGTGGYLSDGNGHSFLKVVQIILQSQPVLPASVNSSKSLLPAYHKSDIP